MEGVVTAMTAGMTTIAGYVVDMVEAGLPILLPVVGIVIATTFGIRFIRHVIG